MTHVEFARYSKEKWLLGVSMLARLFPYLYSEDKEKNVYLRTDLLPICCILNLSKINLSGIFTIENIFLPFRNLIVACMFFFFLQFRPCDVLKGITVVFSKL